MIKTFRTFGWLEGVSFLVLLLIAMPLKYHWGLPQMVRITGAVHGMLFLAYVAAAFAVYDQEGWTVKKLGLAIFAAFLPFGTFVFNAKALREPA